MNVLWIVNAPLPEALSILQGSKVESHSTGSWVCALLELFCGRADIELSAEDVMSTTFVNSCRLARRVVTSRTSWT